MKFSMTSVSCAILLSLLMHFTTERAAAQERTVSRKWGLTAIIQNGQGALQAPFWFGNKLTVAPGFSLNYLENGPTIISLYVTPRYYLNQKRISTYVSGTLGARLNNQPAGIGDTTDGLFGAGLGGEFWLNTKFSLGVESRLNIQILDIGGAGTMSAMSASIVHANVYF